MPSRDKRGPGAHRVEVDPNGDQPKRAEARGRFRLLTIPEVLERPPQQYLVRGILGRGELVMLFGPPASGKTFIIISVALSVAAGVKWHGHDVHAGLVVYVAAEGAAGLGLRLKAWIEFNKSERDLRMRVVEQPVQFMQEEDVDGFIEALKELSDRPVLVVIDTLARCIDGGDENTARDMGVLISGCDRIRLATGASVVLVHHSGKNSDSERGSSALRGAVHTALAVSRSKDGGVSLSCVKQKDGVGFENLAFDLQVVDLGMDAEGYPISSCVLSPKWLGTQGGESHGPLGATSLKMCQTLWDSFFENGATSEQWRTASGVSKSTFYRRRKELVDQGYVARFEHKGHERFRIGQRYRDEFSPTVPPSPTRSQGSGGTSPTPPPPLKGEVGRTGTGTETESQTSFPHVAKARTCRG